MLNIAGWKLTIVGFLALLFSVFLPHPASTQPTHSEVSAPDYLHGSVSLGFDHSYGTLVPVVPRLFAGTDWKGKQKEAEWFVIGRLYQAFGTYDDVTNPREAVILTRLTYPTRGLFNRGLVHGFVVALPIESVGSGLNWASTQAVGPGIIPLKTKLLTVSGGMGPGFLYVDEVEVPSEVSLAGVYQTLLSGHLTKRISYASFFMGTVGAGDLNFIFNISKIIYRFNQRFSAQVGVISVLADPYTSGGGEFWGHSRIALTYHLW